MSQQNDVFCVHDGFLMCYGNELGFSFNYHNLPNDPNGHPKQQTLCHFSLKVLTWAVKCTKHLIMLLENLKVMQFSCQMMNMEEH
jgi:hypothetical protein